MEIKDNVLIRVTDEDIVDGTFVIPDYITEIYDSAFETCTTLIEIDIPNNVEYIGNSAFSICNNLKKVKLPNKLNIIEDYLFNSCPSLEEVIIPDSIKIIGHYAFFLCESLKNINLPQNLVSIGDNAFNGCESLEELFIPPSVTSIGNRICDNCISLIKVILSNNIKIIPNHAFNNCQNLKEINIPDNVLEIGRSSFYNCIDLEKIDLSDKITKIQASAFECCYELKEIKLPQKLTKIERYAFSSCQSLIKIDIPDSVYEIESGAFNKCYSLESVILPINLTIINENLFSECSKLKEINIPDNVILIEPQAFEGCNSLTEIKLPKGIKKIKERAFGNCLSLKEMIIPESAKVFANSAIFGCNNLKRIVFESSFTHCEHSLTDYFFVDEYRIYKQKQDTTYINFEFEEDLIKIRKKELLDKIYELLVRNNHIYNLKREDFDYYYETNDNFKGIVSNILLKIDGVYNYQEDLEKFDTLFPHTRFSNLPLPEIFENLDNELASKYNVKIIRELMKINVFNQTYETKKNIIDVVAVFGLFENDKYVYSRLNILKDLFKLNLCFDAMEFSYLYRWYYFFIEKEKAEYILKKDVIIPEELKMYLKEVMHDYNIMLLKKLDKRFGKRVNDFFRENYELKYMKYYSTIPGINLSVLNAIMDEVTKSGLKNQITVESLNRMFNNSPKKYHEKALNFIVKYFKLILSNEEYQSKVGEILENYNIIEKFYKSKGNTNFNYLDAYNYLNQICFKNINEDNYEFAILVKNAGVTSQKKFEIYQELYEIMKLRRTSTIPRINEEILINVGDKGYKIGIEILRKDDPFAMLVGESKYTNCCQKLFDAGEACMIHSIGDGRVFCTYLIDENNNKMLLSESWMWRCGNMICFDNIEGTSIMKEDKIYSDIVAACYKKVSERLVTVGKQNNDKIEVISIGEGYDDLGLENYFDKKSENNIKPLNYNGYVDSHTIYYVIGNKDLINANIIEKNIYADERNIIKQSGLKIEQKNILKLKKIDDKYNEVNDLSDLAYYLNINSSDINIVLGEDFALIYSIDEKQINIHDIIIQTPSIKDEEKNQINEIEYILYEILKLSAVDDISIKEINVEINNSKAYMLFLKQIEEGNIILLEEEKLDKKTYKIRFKVNNLLDKGKKYTK